MLRISSYSILDEEGEEAGPRVNERTNSSNPEIRTGDKVLTLQLMMMVMILEDETWSFVLLDEHRLRVSRILLIILGVGLRKGYDVTGELQIRVLHKMEIHSLQAL